MGIRCLVTGIPLPIIGKPLPSHSEAACQLQCGGTPPLGNDDTDIRVAASKLAGSLNKVAAVALSK